MSCDKCNTNNLSPGAVIAVDTEGCCLSCGMYVKSIENPTKENRALYWEKQYAEKTAESDYYQAELVKAHTLLGRVIHQLSEKWDTANLTKYFPTDNFNHKRSVGNAKGIKK